MSTDVIVYVLTALAAVVVVLTRLRLRGEEGGAGRVRVPGGVLWGHTVAGVLALLTWVPFLAFPEDTFLGGPLMGIIGLGLWWVTSIFGLLVLMRWLPSRGRHATDASSDTWSEGPGLSVLAHIGMVVGVAVFTFAYLTSAV